MCMARPCDIDPPNTGIFPAWHRQILRHRGHSFVRAPANGGMPFGMCLESDVPHCGHHFTPGSRSSTFADLTPDQGRCQNQAKRDGGRRCKLSEVGG
jgi:hypothetical protein